jgi:hypothetical protein
MHIVNFQIKPTLAEVLDARTVGTESGADDGRQTVVPAVGLLRFETDSNAFQYYDATAGWTPLLGALHTRVNEAKRIADAASDKLLTLEPTVAQNTTTANSAYEGIADLALETQSYANGRLVKRQLHSFTAETHSEVEQSMTLANLGSKADGLFVGNILYSPVSGGNTVIVTSQIQVGAWLYSNGPTNIGKVATRIVINGNRGDTFTWHTRDDGHPQKENIGRMEPQHVYETSDKTPIQIEVEHTNIGSAGDYLVGINLWTAPSIIEIREYTGTNINDSSPLQMTVTNP